MKRRFDIVTCQNLHFQSVLSVVVSTPRFGENEQKFNHYIPFHSHCYRKKSTFQQMHLLPFKSYLRAVTTYARNMSIMKARPGDSLCFLANQKWGHFLTFPPPFFGDDGNKGGSIEEIQLHGDQHFFFALSVLNILWHPFPLILPLLTRSS